MATKIGQFNPVTKWGINKTDNGFEYLNYEIIQIDTTHTEVSMSFNLDLGKTKGQIISLIAQTEIDTDMIPLVKQVGNGVSINRANFGLGSMGKESFTITHSSELEEGYEIKIGTASAILSTSTSLFAFSTAAKFYAHHQNGYYFVFYHNGTGPRYRSSADGTTWGAEQSTMFSVDNAEKDWGVRFNGADVLAATNSGSFNSRRWVHGTIHASAGTISWSSENTGADGNHRTNATPCFLDGVKVSLGSKQSGLGAGGIEGGSGSLSAPTWRGLDNTDVAKTYIQANGDPQSFQDFSAEQEASGDIVRVHRHVNISNLTVTDRHSLDFFYYDDSAGDFDTTELEIANNTATPNHLDSSSRNAMSCARDSNGDIHVVYLDLSGTAPAGAIVHKKVTVIGPGSSTLATIDSDITSLTTHERVFLSIDLDNNDLYLIYDKGDDKLYYRIFDGTWGSENNLKTDTTALVGAVSGFEFKTNSEIGICWTEGTTPFDIVFETISVGAAAVVVPDETLAPTVQMTNSGGMVGGMVV